MRLCIQRASLGNPQVNRCFWTLSLLHQQLPISVSLFLAFCAITMLALFLNPNLNKQTLHSLMPVLELCRKAQLLFLWISLLPIFSQVLPFGDGWVEKTCMLFAFAERTLGLSKFLRTWMGQCQSSEKILRALEAAFSLLHHAWSLAADQMRALPPAEQVIPSLCSSYLFWLKHTLKGSRTEGQTVCKWRRMGSPALLCWLFFLFWLSLETLQQRKIFSVKMLQRFRVSSSGNPAIWWWAALHSIFYCI